jgi:hypothetical protein
LKPVPLLALAVVQETRDAGIAVPLGGTKFESAFTPTRRRCPDVKLPWLKLKAVGLGDPVVFALTLLTAKLTDAGTVTLTDSAESTTPPATTAISTEHGMRINALRPRPK